MKKTLLYFGCIRDKGHYLWESDGRPLLVFGNTMKQMPGINPAILTGIDGMFPPANNGGEGVYSVNIINEKLIIIAWWDYSIDNRPGSNSALIGYGYKNEQIIISDAMIAYPSVMTRQRKLLPFKY